jgi:glucose dehydrogenase
VPDIGLVAIDKASARGNASAKWIAPGMTQWIAEDANLVYVADASSRIVALDKATGEPQFHSAGAHFAAFATNQADATIYAVTSGGRFCSVRSVLRPGWVGTLVRAPDGVKRSRDALMVTVAPTGEPTAMAAAR